LLNRLLKHHVSIVAPRPQTTRHRVTGILNGEGFQAVLLDTPGLLQPKYRLQEFMKREIEQALADADVVLLLVDAAAGGGALPEGLEPEKTIVALNKTDLVRGSPAGTRAGVGGKESLLPLAARCSAAGFSRVFMISALKGGGVEDLKRAMVAALPEGVPFYTDNLVSERPERFFAAEFVREVIFNRYGEEIPYCSSVAVEEFRERPGRKDYIRAVIHVERESQKAIVIGEGGRALKRVGQEARKRLEEFLGRPVYLELWVKVAEKWRHDDAFIRNNVYGRDKS
jgi:GTP-binding protein Era